MIRKAIQAMLACVGLTLGGVGAQAQDRDTGPDPTEAIAKLKEGLKGVNARDEDEKSEAIEKVRSAIDEMTTNYSAYDEKQQREVAKQITAVFSVRLKNGEEDREGQQIYQAAAAALSEMGEMGEVGLKKAMKTKSLKKMVDVQTLLIEALGKHKNDKNVDMLTKLLVDDDPKIVKSAVVALSEYRDAEGKVRKKIVEELVKQYATTYNADLKAKGNDTTARERLLAIEVPMNQALSMLTLQNFQSAPEWEKWYNDNRNRKW